MLFSAKSDVGLVRPKNEDAYYAESFSHPPFLFAVADGMGGHAGGAEAAQLAIATLREGFWRWRQKLTEASANTFPEAPQDFLGQTLRLANSRILAEARASAKDGMGTTLSTTLFWRGRVFLAHIGDSRVYLYRRGQLALLTEDHSLVGELVRNGSLSEEEAQVHPQRHVLTDALGTHWEPRLDYREVETEVGDTFLLCTDGLTNLVGHQELLEIMGRTPLGSLPDQLVEAALSRGGYDNITVVAFQLEAGDFQ